MTKKDYVLIADCLGKVYFKIRPNSSPEAVFYAIKGELIDAFVQDNPEFEGFRFDIEIYKQKNNQFAEKGAI